MRFVGISAWHSQAVTGCMPWPAPLPAIRHPQTNRLLPIGIFLTLPAYQKVGRLWEGLGGKAGRARTVDFPVYK